MFISLFYQEVPINVFKIVRLVDDVSYRSVLSLYDVIEKHVYKVVKFDSSSLNSTMFTVSLAAGVDKRHLCWRGVHYGRKQPARHLLCYPWF